jgi:hypothetical protein
MTVYFPRTVVIHAPVNPPSCPRLRPDAQPFQRRSAVGAASPGDRAYFMISECRLTIYGLFVLPVFFTVVVPLLILVEALLWFLRMVLKTNRKDIWYV